MMYTAETREVVISTAFFIGGTADPVAGSGCSVACRVVGWASVRWLAS